MVPGAPAYCPNGSRTVADGQAQWIARSFGRPELAPLGSDDIDELARLLREEHYPAGATIFRMGEAPTRIGIVRRGAVELSRDLNGRRVMLQILRTGDAVGDVGLFLRITAPYDGMALEEYRRKRDFRKTPEPAGAAPACKKAAAPLAEKRLANLTHADAVNPPLKSFLARV